MPLKATRTGGNKKSGGKKKTSSRSSQKGHGTSADPVDISNTKADKAETPSKPELRSIHPKSLSLGGYHQLLLKQIPVTRAIEASSTPLMRKQE